MASLITRADGNREIQIVMGEQRPKIRLGRVPKKTAESILRKVEKLVHAKLSSTTPEPEVSDWQGTLPQDGNLMKRFAKLGLVNVGSAPTQESPLVQLGKLIDKFTETKRPQIGSRSSDKLVECLAKLKSCFGDDTDIRTLNPPNGTTCSKRSEEAARRIS